MEFKNTKTTPSANGFPCKICGKKALSFHFGACDDCTEFAVALLVRKVKEGLETPGGKS